MDIKQQPTHSLTDITFIQIVDPDQPVQIQRFHFLKLIMLNQIIANLLA